MVNIPQVHMKKNKKVFIIAEAGINHNGDVAIAEEMIDVAKKAGADAVKFQTFRSEELLTESAPKARYQLDAGGNNESQFKMLQRRELNEKMHIDLIKHCKKKNIIFISSPFDLKGIDLLDKLGIQILKIPSGEVNNLPYLRKIGRLGKKVIISTGMSTLKEVDQALRILVKSGTPKKNIVILHCNTAYPTPYKDVNLLAMLTIRNRLKVQVGYSDHTCGMEVSVAAVALGASIIEKHFTLDRNMKGPDHRASVEPFELRSMIKAIRNIEKAMGNGIKKPQASEIKNIKVVRKGMVASRDIKKGEVFTEENIAVKRPATGITPMEWDKVIGSLAKKSFFKDEVIKL